MNKHTTALVLRLAEQNGLTSPRLQEFERELTLNLTQAMRADFREGEAERVRFWRAKKGKCVQYYQGMEIIWDSFDVYDLNEGMGADDT